jgi:hypothetical protein
VTARTLNLKRRRLHCLRCGTMFWTDRCHRVCKKCSANGREPYIRPIVMAEGVALLCNSRLSEGIDEPCTSTFTDGTTEEIE